MMQFKWLLKLTKKLLNITGIIVTIFFTILFSLHLIPVNSESDSREAEFYLMDNGQHIDIILYEDSVYQAYGWGSKIFFTEVNNFEDLTVKTAIQSLFTEPASLMRVIKYKSFRSNWYKVNCTNEQFIIMQDYIHNSYYENLKYNDQFYYAKGKYNALNTCNTWVNKGLKEAGLKAVVYTLISSPISGLYEKQK